MEIKPTNKIYGIKYSEIFSDSYIFWNLYLRNPFKKPDGLWYVGINEKLLTTAVERGVKYFNLVVGNREIEYYVPDQKRLKQMTKEKQFEMKPSLFENSKPYKIYHFKLEI